MPTRNKSNAIKIGPWWIPERLVNHIEAYQGKHNLTKTAVIIEALENHMRNRIKIGTFTIKETGREETIWIEQEDGEGSEFNINMIDKVIRKFCDDNF